MNRKQRRGITALTKAYKRAAEKIAAGRRLTRKQRLLIVAFGTDEEVEMLGWSTESKGAKEGVAAAALARSIAT